MSNTFGTRLKMIREEKKLKREDIAQKIGTSSAIIGRYERGERTPSIDIAKSIADALGVTIDYLVNKGDYEHIDDSTLKRLQDIQKLSEEQKSHVFALLDAFIKQSKLAVIL